MRYPKDLTPPHLYRIPGASSKGSRFGLPYNCRKLLTPTPPEVLVPEPWLSPPPELADWVGDWLTPYQKAAWRFAQGRSGSLLHHPPGAGKTAAAICIGLSKGDKIIVVTRATTKRQWQREVQWLSSLRPVVLHGKTPTHLSSDVRCVILSWEILAPWIGTLLAWAGSHGFTVIFDEIHKAKSWKRTETVVSGPGKRRYVPLKNISASAAKLSKHATSRVGLSATPMPNTLADVWSVLDILEPGEWGTSWAWMLHYCNARRGEYGGLDASGSSHEAELKLRFSEVAHRVEDKEVFANMPPKRRELCYLSREEQSRPQGFKEDLKQAAKRGQAALFEMRLMEAAARKRAWVIDTAEDCIAAGQKVTIFTGRRKDCEKIASALQKRVDKIKGAKLWSGHGGTSLVKRDAMVQAYSSCPDTAAFVGTTDAFGEAIDGLQNSDLAICCLLPWNGGRIEQMEGRFYRKSSTRPVRIMYVIAEGTVDEHVSDLVLTKLNVLDKVLDGDEARAIANTLSGLDDEDAIIASIINKMGDI